MNDANVKLMQWTHQLRQGYASKLTSTCISLDSSEGKHFSFVIHCDIFALWCIVVKNTKQILGFEGAR